MRRPRGIFVPLLAVAALAGAAPAAADATTTLHLDGSTAAFPLLELLTAKYEAVEHHHVKFIVGQGGSSVGITDVANGTVNIGDAAAPPTSSNPAGLYFYPIARYFVDVVTNPANPISNLTTAQVQAIFERKVTNWSQVTGSSLSTTIDVESRTSVAGVLTTFASDFLLGKTSLVWPGATQWSSEALLQKSVEGDPNSIGFLSDYNAITKKLNDVAFNGVAGTVANVENGTYPAVADFYEVTKGPARGYSASFIGWIQSSKAAKKIIETGWLPLTSTKAVSG
jgi:phosphate transport system substrate-binding protein